MANKYDMKDYSWPRPRHWTQARHAVATALYIVNNPKCMVLNEIGTYKTASALWATDYLHKKGEVKRTLLITPKTSFRLTWGQHLFEMRIKLKHVFLESDRGTKRSRLANLANPAIQLYIINPEALASYATWYVDSFKHKKFKGFVTGFNFDQVIIDEQTKFKTPSATSYTILKQLYNKLKPKYFVTMSGDPNPQAATDIWCIGRLVTPQTFRESFNGFREVVMVRRKYGTGWENAPGYEHEIYRRIKHCSIRFTRDKCVDIPKEQYIQYSLDPSKEQLDLEKQLKEEAYTEIEEKGFISVANEAAYRTKALQLASGFVYYIKKDGSRGIQWVNCKSKLDLLGEITDTTSNPIIVFTPYRAPLILLSAWAKKHKAPFHVVHGGVRDRDKKFRDLQDNKIRFLFAHPKCMQYSLTLSRSHVVMWWCMHDSRDTYTQANGRVLRAGQKNKPVIYLPTTSKLERVIIDRHNKRNQTQGAFLEMLETKG